MLKRIKRTKKQLFIISGVLVFYFLLNYFLMLAESSRDDAQIKNYGDSIWYSYVTLTTLGYGDVLPITWTGKFIGAIFILGSIVTLSYVVGKVTENISDINERRKMGHNGTNFTDHIIVIGWDNFAELIVKELMKANKKVAVVIDNKEQLELLLDEYPKDQMFLLYSAYNNFPFFDKININKAKIAFINHGNDTDKLVFVINLRKHYPDLKIMLSLDESNLKETFESAGVSYVLSKNEISSRIIASFIFEPDVANYTVDLLESAESGNKSDYDIQQFQVNNKNPYYGKIYGDAFNDIKKVYNSVLIGISKYIENGKNELMKLPNDNVKIELNDYLIILTEGESAAKMEKAFFCEQGS